MIAAKGIHAHAVWILQSTRWFSALAFGKDWEMENLAGSTDHDLWNMVENFWIFWWFHKAHYSLQSARRFATKRTKIWDQKCLIFLKKNPSECTSLQWSQLSTGWLLERKVAEAFGPATRPKYTKIWVLESNSKGWCLLSPWTLCMLWPLGLGILIFPSVPRACVKLCDGSPTAWRPVARWEMTKSHPIEFHLYEIFQRADWVQSLLPCQKLQDRLEVGMVQPMGIHRFRVIQVIVGRSCPTKKSFGLTLDSSAMLRSHFWKTFGKPGMTKQLAWEGNTPSPPQKKIYIYICISIFGNIYIYIGIHVYMYICI